jgi:hypothetical protein
MVIDQHRVTPAHIRRTGVSGLFQELMAQTIRLIQLKMRSKMFKIIAVVIVVLVAAAYFYRDPA